MSHFRVTVHFPDQTSVEEMVPVRTTFKQIADKYAYHYQFPVLGAVVNNSVTELGKEISKDCSVDFFTIQNPEGRWFFIRSLIFILVKAAKEMFPHAQLHIEYSVGNGYYCYFKGLDWIKAEEVAALEQRMKELIASDFPFKRKRMLREEAIELFRQEGMADKVKLLSHRANKHCSVYVLCDMIDYFYGQLAYSTGAIHTFRLMWYHKGLVLLLPGIKDPSTVPAFQDSPKFMGIIRENNEWLDILKLDTVGQLNEAIAHGKTKEMILVAESLHEKKIAIIADELHRRKDAIKIVAIAGPSSSGKTTTAFRLDVQLRVNGFIPFPLSLDNYFKNREETPKDENGVHDYECLEAIDLELFNTHLQMLLDGHEIALQKYDFVSGRSVPGTEKTHLPEHAIILVEGIHALNPKLFYAIPSQQIYRVYVSALTQLNLDYHNRIPTTDCRLLRRLVRDANFRGHDAYETLKRWPLVRAGEEKHIFPYQEKADIMFNSSLVYEFSILKKYAEPILIAIDPDRREFLEAKRLLKFLSFFEVMDDTYIPYNSILREFIGHSIFSY